MIVVKAAASAAAAAAAAAAADYCKHLTLLLKAMAARRLKAWRYLTWLKM